MQYKVKTVHALKNIDLDIPTGKVFGIIGKSGAGKSSLLCTLNGLERISEGHIHIHQQDLAALSHAAADSAPPTHWYDFPAFQFNVCQNSL